MSKVMDSINASLQSALAINGTIGAAIGDWGTGFSLGQVSLNDTVFPTSKLEQAIAFNSEVIKAKNRTREALAIAAPIEDILITLEDQYHLIRMCETAEGVFFYLVMEREKANLGLARIKLRQIEKGLQI
ncbi:MAG: hypothetical protein AAFR30_02140 [Cyanobacteria bacterium J06628_4]